VIALREESAVRSSMSTRPASLRSLVSSPEPDRLFLSTSRVALSALTLGFGAATLLDVSVPLRTQMVVYLVGMVALNLPHGGYEHFDNLRRRGLDFGVRYVAAYLALVAGFVGLLVVAPVAGLALAVTVAVLKGGHGGLHVLEATVGTGHLRTRVQRALAVAARGGAVMAVPVVAWPETFRAFSAVMVSVFDPGGLAAVSGSFDLTRPLVGGGYAAVVLAHLGLGLLRAEGADRRSWLVDAGETLLLVAYFATVPVLVAVGLYFPLWYSARQVARTAAVDRPGTDEGLLGVTEPNLVPLVAWGVLVVGAVATGAVLAGVYLVAPNPLGGVSFLPGAVAFWSLFISVVALPHVVVGSWYDRDGGIWYVPDARE
jgi:Brp/Blh family beta-carotene 15,15'-monooxygenase